MTGLFGCGSAGYMNNVSEIRENIFIGETDNFEVNIFSGKRENPYKADGIADKMMPYFLVIIELKFESEADKVLNVDVKIGNETYKKSITKDVFRDKYIFDFGKLNISGDITVNLQIDLHNEDVAMSDLSKDLTKTYLQVLEEAMVLLQEKYNETNISGKYECEIYIKLCYKKFMNYERLYWYVAILDTRGNISSVMIDAI